MDVQNFINSVATGNAIEAKQNLNDLLSARAFDALESKKIDIAKTLFNGDQGPDEEEPTEEEPITPPVNEIQ